LARAVHGRGKGDLKASKGRGKKDPMKNTETRGRGSKNGSVVVFHEVPPASGRG